MCVQYVVACTLLYGSGIKPPNPIVDLYSPTDNDDDRHDDDGFWWVYSVHFNQIICYHSRLLVHI